MRLNPDLAPSAVSNKELWLEGVAGPVQVGDLWLLSWDRDGLGLLVVTRVDESFVLGWPATLPSDPAYSPAVPVLSPFGDEIYIWPTRETGVGLHLLHRRYGSLVEPSQVNRIKDIIDDDEPRIEFAPDADDADMAMEHSERMLEQWESICFNEWPQVVPGETPLNHHVLQAHNVLPSTLGHILQVPTLEASSIYKGTRIPTAEQLALVSQKLQVDIETLASPPLGEGAKTLMMPMWKEQLLEAAESRGVSEPEARRGVQDEFALAARSNQSIEDRMHAALARFGER